MTEAEWLACDDPEELFKAVSPPASKRKLLLFCVHFCFFDNREPNPDTATCQHADLWRLTERFADGEAGEEELRRAWGIPDDETERKWESLPENWALHCAQRHDGSATLEDPEVAQLLREIFGNPFRPVSLDPLWLTFDVQALAHGIYEERAFDRMPILADALQDAGCTNEDVLNHCRDPQQVHVRGCWVLDLLLGKG